MRTECIEQNMDQTVFNSTRCLKNETVTVQNTEKHRDVMQ